MATRTITAAAGARIRERTTEATVPWFVWAAVLAVFSGAFGAHWDISWHRSIGRDTFWSAPHIAIYLKGVLGGITFGYLILHTTFARREADDVVGIWGFRGPLGAFIGAWGGITMIASGPFDDWWHNAYGLDTKIVSPPHVLLMMGSYGVTIGAFVLVQAMRGRADAARRRALLTPLLILAGSALVELMIFELESVLLVYQHSAAMYQALALGLPLLFCAFAVASGHRWTCTIVAAFYTVFLLLLLWMLPLFPAEPKLGPVYQHVTHFIPNGFPVLLVAPAFAIDLVLDRMRTRPRWLTALAVGTVFLLVLIAVQWPFAAFLQSPAARNAFFGSHYISYFVPPMAYIARYLFYPVETTAEQFWIVLGVAFIVAPISARIGLSAGAWASRLRR
jgi:hypothetical protein